MSDDWTPAHHAVEHGDAKMLARLLAEGTHPDEACHGMTLLTRAIDSEVDGATQTGDPLNVDTTAVLLAFGADPELRDHAGNLPLQMAMLSGHHHAVDLLRAHISRRPH